ncbi:MAG: hypothetical protein RIS64_2539 [Bacteroidota bacterium]|jgi:hypothetical protein
MNQFLIAPYTPADDAGARTLCKIPVSGNIVLALEREPNYYAGALLQYENPEIYVCHAPHTGGVCGLFSIGYRRIFMGGQLQKQRYFADLRIDPAFQKTRLFYQIVQYLKTHHLTPTDGNAALTVVFTDNLIMQNMIKKRNGDIRTPCYHYVCNYFTQIMPLSSHRNPFYNYPKYIVRKATMADAHLMQSFLLENAPKKQGYPYYDYTQMSHSYYQNLDFNNYYLAFEMGKLVGFCAVWNQKNIKQTRIVSYSKFFSLARPIINMVSKIIGGFQLPPAGSISNYFYIHNVLITNNLTNIFETLLHQIQSEHQQKRYDYFMVGLCEGDDLLNIFTKIKSKRTVQGKVYAVNDSIIPPSYVDYRPYYLEIGRI